VNLLDNQLKSGLRKDRDWGFIDGELCLISDFIPLAGSVVINETVTSPNTSLPYASISIECKKSSEKIIGYVTHKIDFFHLWKIFKDRGIDNNKEAILMYWTAKHYKHKILQKFSNLLLTILGGTPFPKMVIMVCPKGIFKGCSGESPLFPDKEIMVSVYGLMPVKWYLPELMK